MGEFPIGFGRYQLVERLAVGGMAELFVATSPGAHGFQKRVVIKRLLPHLVKDETYKAMFIDEAKLTVRLVHPKIAQTFELEQAEDMLYIAMEYVDGIDVLALLREFASKRRRIEQPLAAWIAHEVLDALDYAHNLGDEHGGSLRLVHRDISPSNVLLSVRGDVKLVDFGIARAVDPNREHKSKTGMLKGKYGYMSPEQVIEQGLDARSDLFSVGVVLAELLTGRRLFAAANELDVLLMVRDAKLHRLDKYGADIEPGLAAIVRKALRKSVDERWQTAAAFRDALAEWLYEHRHRVTNRIVADVVSELRDSVVSRRQRQMGGAAASPAEVPPRPRPADRSDHAERPDHAERSEGSETDGVVMMMDADPGDSMPNISVSYDPPPQQPIAEEKRRPMPVSELAGSNQLPALPPLPAGLASTRGEVAPARPGRLDDADHGRVPVHRQDAVTQPLTRQLATEPMRVMRPGGGAGGGAVPGAGGGAGAGAGAEAWPRMPGVPDAIRAERGSTGSGTAPIRIGAEGVIEVPIADTISAAVEAITLDAHTEESVLRALDAHTEDSVIRAFDDLSEPQERMLRMPTEEEAMLGRPPTPPALADILEPPDDSGDFSVTPPLRVLFRLMTARATGLLVVAVGGVKKDIYVRDGMPEYVSSNIASELFGNYLVTKGVLSDGELAMALAMMPHYGGKLGDTLVGLGLMKPLEVFRHLTRQVRTKIIDVCSWNKGTFAWYAGRENPREAFPLDFNAFEILGAGAMAMPDDHIEAWIAKHGQVRLRAARTRRVGPDRFEVVGLVELFALLDGRRSVGDLVELTPDRVERQRTGRMLCLLEACDLARPS